MLAKSTTMGSFTYASVTNLFSSSLLPTPAQQAELSDLLRSNSGPRDPTSARSVIAGSRLELARYNIDIRILKAALEGIISDRDAFQLHVDRCSSLFAPIRALPPEILVKIFAFSETSHFGLDFISDRRINPREHMERLAKHELLRLSRVCSVWRSVIMGTPSLWATIHVDLDEWWLPSASHRLDPLLSAAIERAGSFPLKFSLRARMSAGDHRGRNLRVLAQCCARWQSLSLWIHSGEFRHLASIKGNIPLLEKLDIHGDWLQEFDVFEDAPRLPPLVPWDQLRALDFEDGNAENLRSFMSLIPRCPNLSSVKFLALDVSDLTTPLALQPIQCNTNCLSVTLRNTRDSLPAHCTRVVSDMLDCFTLPCAKQLAFRMDSPWPLRWANSTFMAFLSRSSSSATITSLALEGIAIEAHELLESLPALPRLETVSLADLLPTSEAPGPVSPADVHADCIIVTDELLRQLRWTPDDPCLVPCLRVFSCTSLFRFTPQMMLDFVASRAEACRIAAAASRFELRMRRHPEVPPVLDPALIAGLDVLQRGGDIWYCIDIVTVEP
ncbi:hypothetical protein GGX14DRAFT_432318 [Mycena pura]|uniref:F-box domain-containing protein n=1 Tax=Mycena pura TaxID=153505 RepID=A0AAD6VS06_9AGAR|nr:hypothetical protein GGX14DRAFT_432318 [Mycena pura]